MSYVAFISYKHDPVSRPHAEALEAALKQYSKPLWKPPIAIFRDERVLRPGDDLPRGIRKALEASQFVLYLATAKAAQSEWVAEELRVWCKDLGRADRLIIAHVADAIAVDPQSGTIDWERTDALPRLLEPYLASIPIWADLSWARTAEQRNLDNVEYHKLVNGITARLRSITPGEMNDQQVLTHRRNMQVRNAVLAAVLMFAGVATYYWDQARRDRDVAQEATRLAEDRLRSEEIQRADAVAARETAEAQRKRADEERGRAEEERTIAERERARAKEQQALAEDRARRIETADGFRLLGQSDFATAAPALYDELSARFARLGLDPVLPMHYAAAARLRQAKPVPLTELEGETSFLRLSADGQLALVVYDYQAPSGSPEPETIPNRTAVGIFHIAERRWMLKKPIGTPLGGFVYRAHPDSVLAIEAPDDIIVSGLHGAKGNGPCERVALGTGQRAALPPSRCAEYKRLLDQGRRGTLPKALEGVMANLYSTAPDDGIDTQYGPRLVDRTWVGSLDGKHALVGTYEGRLLLLDLAAGQVRSDVRVRPVFAAAIQQDGTRALVADREQLFALPMSTPPGIIEASFPLTRGGDYLPETEAVRAAALADDGSVLALATTRRLAAYVVARKQWLSWELPAPIASAAALQVDASRRRVHLVVGDNGLLASADYSLPSAPLRTRSATAPAAVVAWIDAAGGGAWQAEVTTATGKARIRFVPLPGEGGQAREFTAQLRDQMRADIDEPPIVHALALAGNSLVVFHGDRQSSADRDMWDERMAIIDIGGKLESNRAVFKVDRMIDSLGEPHWSVPHIRQILPGSTPNRMHGVLNLDGVVVVEPNGRVTPVGTLLASREVVDRDHVYSFGLSAGEGPPALKIRHHASETRFEHALPWRFKSTPRFAAISPSGRKLMMVSDTADVLLLELTAQAAPRETVASRP